MGITICTTHGRMAFVETCSHVAKQIENLEPPRGHRFTILGNLFVCDDCFNSLGFQKFISLADIPLEEAVMIEDGRWEAFEVAYNAIEGRRCFCVKCFAEFERRSPSAR